MPEPVDRVADYLRTVKTSDAVRAMAWDAVYAHSGNAETDDPVLMQRLQRMPFSNEQRAQLFSLRPGAGNDVTRPDNSILGLPPELAVVSGAGLVRAVAGGGPTMAGRVAAGASNVAAQATPILKYEGVRMALEHFGVPPALAIPIAMAASGYKGGAKSAGKGATPTATAATTASSDAAAAAKTAAPVDAPAPTATPASAAPVEPLASPPAAPAPPAGSYPPRSTPTPPAASSAGTPRPPDTPTAPPPIPVLKGETLNLPPSARTTGQMSEAWVGNDLGLVAKRLRVTLTEAQFQEADAIVRAGKSPIDAVIEVQQRHGLTPAAAPQPATAPPADPSLPVGKDELLVYRALRNQGKTHAQAMKAIEAQRTLAQQLGTPSVSEVEARVQRRLSKSNRTADEQ